MSTPSTTGGSEPSGAWAQEAAGNAELPGVSGEAGGAVPAGGVEPPGAGGAGGTAAAWGLLPGGGAGAAAVCCALGLLAEGFAFGAGASAAPPAHAAASTNTPAQNQPPNAIARF